MGSRKQEIGAQILAPLKQVEAKLLVDGVCKRSWSGCGS